MIFRGKSDQMVLRTKHGLDQSVSDQDDHQKQLMSVKRKKLRHINWGTVVFRVVLILFVLGYAGLMRTNFVVLQNNRALQKRISSLEEKTKTEQADYTEAALQKFLSDFYDWYISRSNPESFEVQNYENKLSAYMASNVILPERERNGVMCYINYYTVNTIKRLSDSELEVKGTLRYKMKTKESIEAVKAKKTNTEYIGERKDVFVVRVKIVDDRFLINSVPALVKLNDDEIIADKKTYVPDNKEIVGKEIEDKDQLKKINDFTVTYLQKFLSGAKDIEYVSADTMVLGDCSLVDIKGLSAYQEDKKITVKVSYRMQIGETGTYVVWQQSILTLEEKNGTFYITNVERGV